MARANAAGVNLHRATLEHTDMREFRGSGAVLAGAESPDRGAVALFLADPADRHSQSEMRRVRIPPAVARLAPPP